MKVRRIMELLILVPLLSLVVSCSKNSKIKKTICTNDFEGYKIETELYSKENTILKSSQTLTIDLAKYGKDDWPSLKEILGSNSKNYKELNGVICQTDENEKKGIFSQKISIDYEKADLNKLSEIGLISKSDEKEMVLDKTVKLFNYDGFSCSVSESN